MSGSCSLCLNIHFLEVSTDASLVLCVCKWSIEYSIMRALWEKEPAPVIHTASQMWLCSHVWGSQSETVKVQRSHLQQRTAGEEVTVRTLLQKSMRTVIALAAPASAERSIKMRVRTAERCFEDQCTYVEWHPKLWCLAGCGSQHERRETEGFQCSSPLSCSGKSLCSGGYLRVV